MHYEWRSPCPSGSTGLECAASRTCPAPGDNRWNLFGGPVGQPMQLLGSACGITPPPVPTSPADLPPEVRPQVTPGIVLTEVRRIGLPQLDIQIQPAGQTLVNFDTIFYAREPTFERNVDLLGYDVDIVAEATTYTWHAGDGTTTRTDDPGGPYPSKDVTHRYSRANDAVSPRVDVTYQVRFRVDGAEWQTIDQPLTATGQAATLAVREAAPVLTS